MKIQESNCTNVSQAPSTVANTGAASTGGGNVRPAGSGSGQDDNVQLSSLSNVLRALDSLSAQQVSKLAQLSKAVATGGYQVDSYLLSNRIIDEHLSAAA